MLLTLGYLYFIIHVYVMMRCGTWTFIRLIRNTKCYIANEAGSSKIDSNVYKKLAINAYSANERFL